MRGGVLCCPATCLAIKGVFIHPPFLLGFSIIGVKVILLLGVPIYGKVAVSLAEVSAWRRLH